MIRTCDINLALGGKQVLNSVSLEVEPGEKVILHGESGSGKTSLLRILVGLHRPDSGKVEYDGMELNASNSGKIRSRLFYMPQEIRPIGDQTVAEFMDVFFSLKATRNQQPTAEEIEHELDRFKLKTGMMNTRMATLSGGERQRVGLARGMLLEREILLLDEVTSAVDGQNRDLIVDRLTGLEGTTIVAVTHDPRFMELASRRVKITGGRLVED